MSYTDLKVASRAAVDAMIDVYLVEAGCPPGLTREQTRDGLLVLVETGYVRFVLHNDPDGDAVVVSLELRMDGTEDAEQPQTGVCAAGFDHREVVCPICEWQKFMPAKGPR